MLQGEGWSGSTGGGGGTADLYTLLAGVAPLDTNAEHREGGTP